MRIAVDSLVDEVMREAPATIRVFIDFKLFGCVGCPLGRFHTVAIACCEHETQTEPFLSALQRAAESSSKRT
jgi:hybrid cluster-associated redox disulfide protein